MPAEIALPLPPSIDALPPSYLIKTPLNSPFSQEAKLETFPLMLGPNITGTFTHNGLEKNNLKTTGAFYHAGQGAHGEGSGYPGATIGFNSNLTNSIYSDVINTVQPPSLVTLACIKT